MVVKTFVPEQFARGDEKKKREKKKNKVEKVFLEVLKGVGGEPPSHTGSGRQTHTSSSLQETSGL